MDKNEVIAGFIKEGYKKTLQYEKIYDNFKSLVQDDFTAAKFLTIDDIVKLIGNRVSRNAFFSKKKFIVYIFKCLMYEDYIDKSTFKMVENISYLNVLESSISTFFYKDIENMESEILKAAKILKLSQNDVLHYIVYYRLSWHGLVEEDMCTLKKNDFADNKICYTLDEKTMSLLKELSKNENYTLVHHRDNSQDTSEFIEKFNKEKNTFKYCDSEYVFRTCRKSRFTGRDILSSYMTRFNAVMGVIQKQLDVRLLVKNKMFLDIYNFKRETNALLSDVLDELGNATDVVSKSVLKSQYLTWEKIFY